MSNEDAVELSMLRAVLDAIDRLHEQRMWGDLRCCSQCGEGWPCPTRRIIDNVELFR